MTNTEAGIAVIIFMLAVMDAERKGQQTWTLWLLAACLCGYYKFFS